MKKKIIGMLAVLCVPFLVACSGGSKSPDSYIKKAELSKEEEKIVTLIGSDDNKCIYDLKVNSSIQSAEINTYELVDGTWVSYTSTRNIVKNEDSKRRLALSFDYIANGIRIVYQDGESSKDTINDARESDGLAGMSYGTAWLEEITEVQSDKEIPLAIQYMTSKNFIESMDIEEFFTPEKIEKQEYDHVYAVSIRFSEKTLEELEAEDKQ